MAGRPAKNTKAAPKAAKEQKVKFTDSKQTLEKLEEEGWALTGSQSSKVVSANDYVNSLIGQQPDPIRVEGHNENEPQVGSFIEEGGEVTKEQFDTLQTGFGKRLTSGAQILDPHPYSNEPARHVANIPAIIERYEHACNTPSDINQLLPYLRAVADECDHITELGVRTPTSTWALLAGNPKQLVSYDIVKDPKVAEVEALAPNFKFVLGSSLEVEIEETDFLFIDTVHTATQLELELAKHANKVRKYIGFHDVATGTFWERGEGFYPGPPGNVFCGRGLRYAIEPFLAAHPEWKISFFTQVNNGLLILKKIG